MSECKQAPLTDQLRGISPGYRYEYPENPTHYTYIPIGKMCHEAAEEIARLTRERDEARKEAERLKNDARIYEFEIQTGRNEQHDKLVAEVERLRSRVKWFEDAGGVTMAIEIFQARAEVERLRKLCGEACARIPRVLHHCDPIYQGQVEFCGTCLACRLHDAAEGK